MVCVLEFKGSAKWKLGFRYVHCLCVAKLGAYLRLLLRLWFGLYCPLSLLSMKRL